MRRTALLFALVLCALWAIAQLDANPRDTIRGSQRETTVQGCLDISAGAYTLTLPSGAVFELKGNTAPLKAHVGDAVQVTGTATPVMNVPGSMSEGTQTSPTIWVNSFQRISGTCTATGSIP